MKSNYTFSDLFDADINSAPFGKKRREEITIESIIQITNHKILIN